MEGAACYIGSCAPGKLSPGGSEPPGGAGTAHDGPPAGFSLKGASPDVELVFILGEEAESRPDPLVDSPSSSHPSPLSLSIGPSPYWLQALPLGNYSPPGPQGGLFVARLLLLPYMDV